MSDNEWVSLRRAAELLGVHPATVRNWADKGDLPSRRTPGGHRRFRVSDLQRQMQADSELQPIEIQVILQSALGQARLQVGDGDLANVPWYRAMRDETRQHMRVQGRALLEELRAFLAAGSPDSGLSRAIEMGKQYAVSLIEDGLTLPQAVRGFLFFSDFVINSVLTWSELTAPRSPIEWAALLRHVNTFMNTMLLSIIEYYQED
ncbi:MAG: helix-turn-helix domain-containing protein [Chloroflexi bacterium]|nr:helix-turn-helix domain-containing protein [Chloroflexota bacterium]